MKSTKLDSNCFLYIENFLDKNTSNELYHNLKEIKDTNFDMKLIDFYNKGGIISGGSAGSLIFAHDIETALMCEHKDENKVKLKDITGLNLCEGFNLQVHYNKRQEKEHREYVKKTQINILGIPDDSSVVISSNNYKVVGDSPINIITSEDSKIILPNEEFKL